MEGVRRRQVSSHDRTRRRRLEQGLPPVSDRDTSRRMNDSLLRTERRHRVQEEAGKGATASPPPLVCGCLLGMSTDPTLTYQQEGEVL